MQTGHRESFAVELNFTETYKKYMNEHIAIREAMCLREQFPAIFTEIQDGDLFAGRLETGLLGFGLEVSSGGVAGYGFCGDYESILEQVKEVGLDENRRKELLDAVEFWHGKESVSTKHFMSMPDQLVKDVTNLIAESGPRLAGVYLDYDKLMKIGLPGLIQQVQSGLEKAKAEGGDQKFFEGMGMALNLFADVCRMYSEQARRLIDTAEDEERKIELQAMSEALEKIVRSKPETLREAIQLSWLYSLIAGVINYGRMDIYLGDFYARDIDSGAISENEALEMLKSLWQQIADRKIVFNGRVIIGGRGRRNEKNADRFALAAMEASRLVKETEPQLTLRFYKGMDPQLMDKALDVIGEGRVYPMLYNDDVNVEAVRKSFDICLEDAEQYLPYGCGEYAIDHKSLSSPNGAINLLKALEVTLHNGKDGVSGKELGLKTGEFAGFETFDELFNAYKKQVEYYLDALAKRHACEYKAERENAAYLFVSALFDECIEKGKSVVDGGARYLGGIVECFAITNVADSLAAIKRLVYEKQIFSKEQLLKMLDANFEGYEKERLMFLDIPKYGNDDDYVDEIVKEVSMHVCKSTIEAGKRAGLHHYLIVCINNLSNVLFGKKTAASADGRKLGDPLANGNTPTAGMDRKGVTAFLNSITKPDPTVHAGYVHNMKFSRQMFNKERAKLSALLKTYFAKGGTQSMITVVSRGDLENALVEPEKYRDLIVRVGGFSARFVELSRDVQMDIVNRTLY